MSTRTHTSDRASARVVSTSLLPGARPGADGRRLQPPRPGPAVNARCLGLVPPPYAYALRSPYVCGDWRLGPVRLPHVGILGSILSGYRRFGGLTPVEFLNKWWDPTLDLGRGNWKYPKDDGFDHDTDNQVIAAPLTLHPGQLVDRFGNEPGGTFLSPAGAKYGERAIPPSNLDTIDPRYPFNYHLYRVMQDTVVCAGPAAPAFQQPGEGVQFVTSVMSGSPYCPSVQTGADVNSLVKSGNLQRAN